jgi:hypothetical protein
MRFVIDIGIQKTGSKLRQSYFAEANSLIHDLTFYYPFAGRVGNWHRPLYEAVRSGDRSQLVAVKEEASAVGAEVVILSYEEFHKFDVAAIATVIDCLSDVEVVVFLRRQDSFVNSFHNQLHKSHRIPIAELVKYESSLGTYDANLDYRLMIDRWGSILGSDNIHPVLYDKNTSPISIFLRAAELSERAVEANIPISSNLAIDGRGMSILRRVKCLVGDDSDLPEIMDVAHKMLAAYFVRDHVEECFTIDYDTRIQIMEHYHASNEWVRERFFAGRQELFPALDASEPRRFIDSCSDAVAEQIVEVARGNKAQF